ncbi:DUF6884 domain-containing protein [Undibacterium arcticum]
MALVSCVKSKRNEPVPHQAQELYVSQLFAGMRRYAQDHADRWYILSAEHGLLAPEQLIKPYEKTLVTMNFRQREEWAISVMRDLEAVLQAGDEVIFGGDNLPIIFLECYLRERGIKVSIPMEGLMFGQQLQWLKRANGEASTSIDASRMKHNNGKESQ